MTDLATEVREGRASAKAIDDELRERVAALGASIAQTDELIRQNDETGRMLRQARERTQELIAGLPR